MSHFIKKSKAKMDDILVMYFRWTLNLVTSMMLVSKEVVLLLYPNPTVMKTTFTTMYYYYCYYNCDVMQHTHSSP